MSNSLIISLIKKFRQQDMTAFTMVYDEFKGLLLFYSKKLADEDALQELTLFFIELLYSINTDTFPSDSTDGLRRYIAVALRNKYIQLSREKQKYSMLCNQLYDSYGIYNENLAENVTVCEALKALSEKQRLIAVYKYIYNYSDAEIAQMLKISRQAVNRLKNRGLEVLKKFYT